MAIEQPDYKYDKNKPIVGALFEDFARALIAVSELSLYTGDAPSVSQRYYTNAIEHQCLKSYIQPIDPETGKDRDITIAWLAIVKLELRLRRLTRGVYKFKGALFEDFPRALLAISELATIGAAKYKRSSWLTVPNGQQRYTDALGRHILLEFIDPMDEETGLGHDVAIAWNAIGILELRLREELV